MKLMVLDGNSILNRAYYGIRPLSTRDGLYTHAVYGFITTLQRLLDEENPEALCVTFDRREPHLPPPGGRGIQGPAQAHAPGAGHAAAGDEAGAFGHVRALL